MATEQKKQSACPTCKAPVRPRQENRAYPFCSNRCRMIDLGRWLGEEYVISEPAPRPPGPGDDQSY